LQENYLKKGKTSYERGEGALSTFFFAQKLNFLEIIFIDYV